MTEEPDFKGYIHDVGGPTARLPVHRPVKSSWTKGVCAEKAVPVPEALQESARGSLLTILQLLRKLRALPKVKKVFIRSGIRFDYRTGRSG